MTYALLPKLEKNPVFAIGQGSRFLVVCFLYTQRPNVFFSDAWQAPTTYHRPSCELCDPRVGRSP